MMNHLPGAGKSSPAAHRKGYVSRTAGLPAGSEFTQIHVASQYQAGLSHAISGMAIACDRARCRSVSQKGLYRITAPSGMSRRPPPVMNTCGASCVCEILRIPEIPSPCLSIISSNIKSGPCCAAAATASDSVCAVAQTWCPRMLNSSARSAPIRTSSSTRRTRRAFTN
jgi:hypothetical protein